MSVPMQISVLNPLQMVQEVAAAFRSAAAKKGLALDLEPGSHWHDVVGDRAKLTEILVHLLANAIASTAAGGVQVTVKPPDGEHWSIVVEDTGPGMTQAETSHLSGDSAANGSGLEVVRVLVEQLEGRVIVRSVIRQGTRIEVCLPVIIRDAKSTAVARPAETNEDSAPRLQRHRHRALASANRPLRLLVVEDHDDLCAILRTFFESLGHEARVVGDLASAVRVADEEPFDVLLSDIKLPDGNGWELLGRLEQTGRRPRYAIAMSGIYGLAGCARSKQAGFALHLLKPFPPENLERALEHAGHALQAGVGAG